MSLTIDDLNYDETNKNFDLDYHALNAKLNLVGEDGKLQLDADKEATKQFFLQHVNMSTVYFHTLEEKIEYLIDNNYYEEDVIEAYSWDFVKSLYKRAYGYKYRFETFLGAFKYYSSYTLKTFDGKRYLERFEDRVALVSLYLGQGDEKLATKVLDEIMTGRYQPATPTFLNAGKAQRGELVSCFDYDTLIDTSNGQKKIGEITVGDSVLTHDGTYKKVEKTIVNKNTENLFSIKHFGSKNPIVSTPNHPILVWSEREVESLIDADGADPKNGFVWLEAQDVQPKDYVVSTFPTEISETRTFDMMDYTNYIENIVDDNGTIKKKNIDRKHRKKQEFSGSFADVKRFVIEDYKLGLIMGWYLSEGHVSKRKNKDGKITPNGVHFTLGTHEKVFQKELSNAVKDVFGINVKINDSYYDGSTKIDINSGIVSRFILSVFGSGYGQKRIPIDVLTANHDFQHGLLHGLFRGDGNTTNGSLSLDLVNPEMIHSVRLILSRLGIISRERTYTNTAGNTTGQVTVPGIPGENEEFIINTAKNLHNYVGLRGGKKNLKNSDFYRIIKGKMAFEVSHVGVTEEKPEQVYNLEVEDNHTYSVGGSIVHNCFLMRVEDSMESIARSITNSLQLSKRGGGVALNLTNLREEGAPIKKIENQSSGVVPVMKMLEDSFSYANQLGARQGAGAVYLNVHHPDIMKFLDTKRENADEKIRIKTLSLGVVIPDVTFHLAQKNEDMYLFSPYDVERVYGVPFSDISVTEKYHEMVEDRRIRKSKIKARTLFQTLAEIQFESGYPYIVYEDTVNKANPIEGRINMSNLCSEILQVNTPSTFHEDGSYDVVGRDISCNLGSLNVARAFDSEDFSSTIDTAIRSLTAVSDLSNIKSVPSIENGNKLSHAIGLGQMNLHGFFAREHIHYDSPEAVDFTTIYFYSVLYEAIKASNKIAKERKETFYNFENSKYATGEFFQQYIEEDWSQPKTDRVKELMKRSSIHVPVPSDWKELAKNVKKYGLYNQNLLAVPPTGSISYINHSTSSIHPIVSPIEIRKEGKLGRVYYPAPYLSDETLPYYRDAYKIGTEAIIDIYAAATQFTDQGLSLTLFYPHDATTRDLNKSYIYAFKNGIKSLYYARLRQKAIDGTEVEGTAADYCESCQL